MIDFLVLVVQRLVRAERRGVFLEILTYWADQVEGTAINLFGWFGLEIE